MLIGSRLRWFTSGAAMLFCCVAQGQGTLPCDIAGGPSAACAQPAPCPPPQPRHVYVCPCPSCQEQGRPEAAPGQPELGPGVYVAPPQTGVQVEGSRQVSVGGLAIRFPEFRFELPTIELPHRTARTRGAHMELDRAIADFRSLPAQPTPQYAYATARQENYAGRPQTGRPAPETAHPQSDDELNEMRKRCEAMAEQLRAKEQLLNCKLIELEQQLQCIRSLPIAAPCPAPQSIDSTPLPAPQVKQTPSKPAQTPEKVPPPQPETGSRITPDTLPLPLTGQDDRPAPLVAPATSLSTFSNAPPATKQLIRLPRR